MSDQGAHALSLADLREKWAAYDSKLDASLRLNRRLLAARHLDRTRSALRWHQLWLGLEVAVNALAVFWLGNFVHDHFASPRFLLPGLHLLLLAVLIEIDLIRQIAATGGIDYTRPVPAIQRQLERLRVMSIRHLFGILLVSGLAWTPLLVVSMKGLFGIDAYRVFSTGWLLANVLFGVAVILLGLWASKRYGERMGRSPRLQRLMRNLAGTQLKSAERFLCELSEFESEPPTTPAS